MDLLSFLSLAAGMFLVGLVAVAMLVAGWELLRQREVLERLRRDRAAYTASAPLPLDGAPSAAAAGIGSATGTALAGAATAATAAAAATAATAAAAAAPLRRESHWTETRPTVLEFAPAIDDERAQALRRRKLDLEVG
jgi:uncharacterized membrane protein YhiD involved in acid resistance